MIRQTIFSVAIVLWWCAAATRGAEPAKSVDPLKTVRFRNPVAVVCSPAGPFAFAANEKSGSVSVLDVEAGRVVAEVDLGGQLADAAVRGKGELLVVDSARHQLVRLTVDGTKLSVLERSSVARYPVGVAVCQDGKTACVSSLWSRRITFVRLGEGDTKSEVAGMVDLPFAPRRVLLVEGDSRLIAADSFGGHLAVLDVAQRKLMHVKDLAAHNIRGLALSPDGQQLLTSHTFLNEYAQSFHSDVTWGVLISNSLHTFPLSAVLDPTSDLNKAGTVHELGIPGQGGADPAGLVVTADGTAVVPLGGAGQTAFCEPGSYKVEKVAAGNHPTGATLLRDGRVLVVCAHDDSALVYDVKTRKADKPISLGPQPELTAADRGERMFHDARLAHDRWMTCHTCHTDGHSNGGLNDNLSDGSYGAPRRVLSLLGVRDTAPYAWNGKMPTLEAQARQSITSTMQGKYRVTDEEAGDLAAYLRTLPAPPSIYAARENENSGEIARGEKVFASLNCKSCHAPPTYTSAETRDVGLKDEQGVHEFQPPSLVGVSQRERLFHDNRAASLEDVVRKFRHQIDKPLADDEAAALLAFLRSL